MKFQLFIIAVVMTAFQAGAQVQSVSKMLGTKHNLSVSGTGTIKASTEQQVCVFCHTPHLPKQYSAAQLWNHQASTAEYTLYSSDYLTNLNYDQPNQPSERSKLCLSCHDGTVALGAVYNNEGSTSITMQNNVTTMPAHATGNLGVSLANDHPVGYPYSPAKDPELVGRSWPWNTPVRLDPDAINGTVECITCHEPHDDTYGKFLRVDNTNAALCTFCHAKAGWSDAIHRTSTQGYTPPGQAATTVGEWACRNCHISHNGLGVPYLLRYVEENTCYDAGCHGSTVTGANTKNIQSEYDKIYDHPTNTVTGKHRDPDDPVSVNSPNRHAECQDCHNPHRAQKGLHTVGSSAVSGVLLGVRGVLPGLADSWTQPTTYTEINPAIDENQICLKCHSSYAFGQVPNGVSTIIGPSGQNETDQAMEFNPQNGSAHPVRSSLNNQIGSSMPRPLAVTAMTSDWGNVGTQTMYCSDCHGNDLPTSATTPQGPHGSNNKFMLTGQGKYWPLNRFDQLWSLADILNNQNNWQTDLFCANCHTLFTNGNFANNVHAASAHQASGVTCVTCHVVVPHGAAHGRLIGYAADPAPYNYNGNSLVITDFQKASDPTQYTSNNCSMNGVCHQAQRNSLNRFRR